MRLNIFPNPLNLKGLDLSRPARNSVESMLEHCAHMPSAPTFDALANIAQAKAERSVRRTLDNRLKCAQEYIAATRKIAASLVGLAATEELLLNEAAATREDLQHKRLIQSLKSGKVP